MDTTTQQEPQQEGNGARRGIVSVEDAREAQRAMERYHVEEQRRARFAPLTAGDVGAELAARRSRAAASAQRAMGAHQQPMAAADARAEVKRAEQAIAALERQVQDLTARAGAVHQQRDQAEKRAQLAREKAERAGGAVATAEERRTAAAHAGDVALVEEATRQIGELGAAARDAASAADALTIASRAIDPAGVERERAEAAAALLDERARLALARLAVALPGEVEALRRRLRPLLAAVEEAVAACAVAGRAPAGAVPIGADDVAAQLQLALAGGEV